MIERCQVKHICEGKGEPILWYNGQPCCAACFDALGERIPMSKKNVKSAKRVKSKKIAKEAKQSEEEVTFDVKFGGLSTPTGGVKLAATLTEPYNVLDSNGLHALFANAQVECTLEVDLLAQHDAAGQGTLEGMETTTDIKTYTGIGQTRGHANRPESASLGILFPEDDHEALWWFRHKIGKITCRRVGDAKESSKKAFAEEESQE
jgi:hypothetical protein